MISIKCNTSRDPKQAVLVKEIPMRLQITFAFDKVIKNTKVFVNLVWINFRSELLNLLRVQQEEIGYAIPSKALH